MAIDVTENSLALNPRLSWVAIAGLTLAVIGGLALMLSGLGYRWGLWGLLTGFTVLRWGLYIGCVALVLSLTGVLLAATGRRQGVAVGIGGIVLSAVVVVFPLNALRTARSLPPIHDITTDTTNPPQFVAVLPLRANARNPVQYGGSKTAAQQKKAYPDIVPTRFNQPPAQVFDRALADARDMGWEIVASDPSQGRIEATATTFWFGFKDDVVVRIVPEGNGSLVDVRSLSRIGGGDLGTNAKRVRNYLAKLKASTS